MSSPAQTNLAKLRDSVFYRKASPVAVILPACRNCTHFVYDADDRMTLKGVSFRRTKLRCGSHHFAVTLDMVCDTHAFHHASRRDK
jgi:hypothetical protein